MDDRFGSGAGLDSVTGPDSNETDFVFCLS